jgi:predicted phosphodiesterase
MISDKKTLEIINYYLINNEANTLEYFNINIETLNRYKRHYKKICPDNNEIFKKGVIGKIIENYTEKELQAIANGGRVLPGQAKAPIINFSGKEIIFAHFTDTHIGSVYFNPEYYEKAIEECKKENVKFICHTGDVVEGMSKREGHIYELTHLGYDKQKEYAIKILNFWKGKYYFIDGNHDRWFIKSNGAIIVKDICEKLKNAKFLGHDEGDISLKGEATIKLWHGEDGSSYAISYRIQKIIESLTGGTKPNILLAGHVHKMGYFFERHIHAFSGGALSTQSSWMRRTRKANHTGFWIIKATINKTGVAKCTGTFYPFYA